MQDRITRLIAATNAFDVETALILFASDAVIDDVSVGDKFEGTEGVRRYLEQFFVGYHTATRVLSIEQASDHRALAHVDFTGDFGHETGVLDISMNGKGKIIKIDADLD